MTDIARGLAQTLRRVNALRDLPAAADLEAAEAIVDDLFRASERLAVYGSLMPGEENHHVIEHVRGRWLDGFVRGELHEAGWGAVIGFPAVRMDPHGPEIPVKLLISSKLPAEWARLDDFEGPDYRRRLVEVHGAAGLIGVANIYEARPQGTAG